MVGVFLIWNTTATECSAQPPKTTMRSTTPTHFGGSGLPRGSHWATPSRGFHSHGQSHRHHANRYSNVVVVPFNLGAWDAFYGGPQGPMSWPMQSPMYPHGHWYGGDVPSIYSPFGSPIDPRGDGFNYGFFPSPSFGNSSLLADLPPHMASATVTSSGPANVSAATSANYPIIITKAIARSAQRRSEAAFRAGEYHLAASLARQVVTVETDNGLAFLFSAQACFAIGNYDSAVQDLREAAKLLSVEELGFVIRNFRLFYGQNDYVRHMYRLEQFLIERPVYVPARIVRGHQWAYLGFPDEAKNDFLVAISYRPNDELANRLLESLDESGLTLNETHRLKQPFPRSMAAEPQPHVISSPKTIGTLPQKIETESLPEPEQQSEFEDLNDFQLPDRGVEQNSADRER
jgi:Tfp pilus assembly protein PilF